MSMRWCLILRLGVDFCLKKFVFACLRPAANVVVIEKNNRHIRGRLTMLVLICEMVWFQQCEGRIQNFLKGSCCGPYNTALGYQTVWHLMSCLVESIAIFRENRSNYFMQIFARISTQSTKSILGSVYEQCSVKDCAFICENTHFL